MIFKKIDNLRIKANVRKTVLARSAGISTAMYYKYLQGSNVPYDVVDKMLTHLGLKLIITVEI